MTAETPLDPWTDARIREAFIDDGGLAEYHDPINGAKEQRRIMGSIFDAWLAARDAEMRRLRAVETDLTGRIDRALSTFGADRSLPLGQSRFRSADHWLRTIRAHLRGEDPADPVEEMHADAMRAEKGE